MQAPLQNIHIKDDGSSSSQKIGSLIQEYLGKSMNLARIKLMADIIHDICVVQTVSRQLVAADMPTSIECDSYMKRFQCFLHITPWGLTSLIVLFLASFLYRKIRSLSMDHTNWNFWDVNINIHMLGITYKKIAFPLLFKQLNQRDNSN